MWARPSYSHLEIVSTDLPTETPTCLNQDNQNLADLSLLRPPIVQTNNTGTGILSPFSIAYAFRPRLRVRLTLSRFTLLRKPWAFGDTEFHCVYRYSCQHTHFYLLQLSSRVNLQRLIERSSTDSLLESKSSVLYFQSRILSAPNPLTSELLRFL